jgi:hypothetical protein
VAVPPIAPLAEYSSATTLIQPRLPAPAATSSRSASICRRSPGSAIGIQPTIASTMGSRTLSSLRTVEKVQTNSSSPAGNDITR